MSELLSTEPRAPRRGTALLRQAIALGAALLLSAPAGAAKLADDCLRTKVWDRYGDGWQVRASTSTEVGFGHTHYYRVSMLKGRTYQVVTCAEDNVGNLDILLYDNKGEVITRDDSGDREPTLSYEPGRTGVHYVVLYVRDAEDRGRDNDVSVALVHR